jgi:acyl carrier protein
MTRDEIFTEVQKNLAEMFSLDVSAITENSRLRDDLDLDSIDAIDLAVRLQDLTGKRVDESRLREVRTVRDVVELIELMLTAHAG